MTVEFETEIARDLVELKLSSIRSTIEEILNNWDNTDPEQFILKTKSGEIEEAEMDAITMRQLLSDMKKYELLLKQIKD